MYKGRYIHTVTSQDIGKRHYQGIAGHPALFEPLGRVLPCDVGKQIWLVNGIYYVENDTQVLKRLALAYIIGTNQAVELPA